MKTEGACFIFSCWNYSSMPRFEKTTHDTRLVSKTEPLSKQNKLAILFPRGKCFSKTTLEMPSCFYFKYSLYCPTRWLSCVWLVGEINRLQIVSDFSFTKSYWKIHLSCVPIIYSPFLNSPIRNPFEEAREICGRHFLEIVGIRSVKKIAFPNATLSGRNEFSQIRTNCK